MKNKVERISLSGGLIGAMTTNPKRALNQCIKDSNSSGWNCTYILPHSSANLVVYLFQLIILVLTLGLWTFGPGYLVLFEKQSSARSPGE